jgi:hypothetical protein
METNIEVLLVLTVKMVMESFYGRMATFIMEIFVMMYEKEMGRWNGRMEACMRGSGGEGFPMAGVFFFITKLGMFKAKG